jgi:hypothetical protein
MVLNCERFKAISNNKAFLECKTSHARQEQCLHSNAKFCFSNSHHIAIMHRTLAGTLTSVDPTSVVVVARCIGERWSTFLRHLSLLG